MFHIKTDIRQYKCESQEKVILLIRNWVIRPTDQIYDADADAWAPIGAHDAFKEVFALIEKEEASEPDTVVTEAPSEIAQQFEVSPGAEYLREDEPTGVLPEAPEGVEGLVRDSDEITMMTFKTLDMLREEAKERDEGAAGQPELDVAGAAPSENSEHSENGAATVEQPLGRHGLPEDVFVTDEIRREDVYDALLDELGALSSDVGPADEPLAEPDEVTQLVERDEFFGLEAASEPADDLASDLDVADLASTRTGFEDDKTQIFKDTSRGDTKYGDSSPNEEGLGEASSRESTSSRESISSREPKTSERANWRISMGQDSPLDPTAELPQLDSDPSADPGDETTVEAENKLAKSRAEEDGTIASLSSGKSQDDLEQDDLQQNSGNAEQDDDDLDAMLSEAAALVGLDPETLREDISGPHVVIDAPPAKVEPADEGAEENERGDDDAGAEAQNLAPTDEDDLEGDAEDLAPGEEPAARKSGKSGKSRKSKKRRRAADPYVSDPYKVSLPFDIGPSPADLKMGLKRSKLSMSEKDKVFPEPRPRKPGEVMLRNFELKARKSRDYSIVIGLGFALLVVALVITAVSFLG